MGNCRRIDNVDLTLGTRSLKVSGKCRTRDQRGVFLGYFPVIGDAQRVGIGWS